GQLVTPDGALVQGWAAAADGSIDVNGPLTDLRLPIATLMGSAATTAATFEGNLPADAEVGEVLTRELDVYDADGQVQSLTLTFTRTAAGWDVVGTRGGVTTPPQAMTFDAAGQLTAGGAITVDGIAVDMSTLTGYAGLTTVEAVSQDGRAAGTLQSFQITADGTLLGSFSNGLKQPLGRVSL